MNKMNKFFLMGTIALSGMTGLTACSSDDDVKGENGGNAAENGVVKTQFALNVPYANTGTRMTTDIAQGGNTGSNTDGHYTFRGISDMRIFTFNTGEFSLGADNKDKNAVKADSKATNLITLGTDKDAMEQDNYRRIYRDVTVPIGTDHFVFYGTATGTATESSSVADKLKTGYLKATGLDNSTQTMSGISFGLVEINANATFGDNNENGSGAVLKALKTVLETKTADYTWSSISDNNDIATATGNNGADAAKLTHAKKLYEKFITLTAGSAASVKKAIEDLRNAIGIDAPANPSTSTNKVVLLLEELYNNCTTALEGADYLNNGNVTFPRNLNLPDGVAHLKFENGTFKYINPVTVGGTYDDNGTTVGNTDNINYNKITYPASLNYVVSTSVKAKDDVTNGLTQAGSKTNWPTYADWTNGDWDSSWGNSVLASTRSIGLKDAIQYGVAQLVLTAKVNGTTLKDNAQAKGGEVTDRTIDVMKGENSDVSCFKVTAVLIGGQPDHVGWDYTAQSGSSFDRTIYDNTMNGGDMNLTTSYPTTPNYTLVLDNKGAGANSSEADVVYVTLELENNSGTEFFGTDGLVPQGGKFYLVGKLDVKTAGNTTGNTADKKGQDHIFVQDHRTIAKFNISSLKNAYNCIPDLRSSSISLGLAVDLTWEEGMSFEYTID